MRISCKGPISVSSRYAWCHDWRGASCGAAVWLEAEVEDAMTGLELQEKGQGQWCATVEL